MPQKIGQEENGNKSKGGGPKNGLQGPKTAKNNPEPVAGHLDTSRRPSLPPMFRRQLHLFPPPLSSPPSSL